MKELLRTLLAPSAPGFDRLDLAVPFLIDLAPLPGSLMEEESKQAIGIACRKSTVNDESGMIVIVRPP